MESSSARARTAARNPSSMVVSGTPAATAPDLRRTLSSVASFPFPAVQTTHFTSPLRRRSSAFGLPREMRNIAFARHPPPKDASMCRHSRHERPPSGITKMPYKCGYTKLVGMVYKVREVWKVWVGIVRVRSSSLREEFLVLGFGFIPCDFMMFRGRTEFIKARHDAEYTRECTRTMRGRAKMTRHYTELTRKCARITREGAKITRSCAKEKSPPMVSL